MITIDKIKEFLERNSKIITEIVEDEDTYRVEDIALLTDLNCRIAEVLLKIEGVKNGIVSTSKTSVRKNKKQK